MEDDERIVDRRAASRMNDDDGPAAKPVDERAGAPAGNADELATAKQEAENNLRNWQRAAADFANFKRRVEQEKADTARIYNASLAINLLPIFDDLDRAVAGVDANLAGLNWVQGIVAIHRKFVNLLQAMQVAEIDVAGQKFDPARHEAIGQQPGEEGRILAVVQKGYLLGDKVIRPAMVIVGNGEKPSD
jgi:molecular chaperone GrpE